jgi:hypothetical protein
MSVIGKAARLARARSLLTSCSDADLLYAALELRLCLEQMTYEKASSFKQFLPPSSLKIWQPPQLLKILKQVDPIADQSFELHIGNNEGPPTPDTQWLPLGKHKAFGSRWLTKQYNKLGSLLHAPRESVEIKSATQLAQLRTDLASMADEIEEALKSTITGMSIHETISADCMHCGGKIAASKHMLDSKPTVVLCLQCEAEYGVAIEANEYRFIPRAAHFSCAGCKVEIWLEHRNMRPDDVVTCKSCGQTHVLRLQWKVELPVNDASKGVP